MCLVISLAWFLYIIELYENSQGINQEKYKDINGMEVFLKKALDINGLVQDCGNPSALAMELFSFTTIFPKWWAARTP